MYELTFLNHDCTFKRTFVDTGVHE